jgi:hypothetical protein
MGVDRRITVQGLHKAGDHIFKKAGSVAQVVEHLPGQCKKLSSKSSTTRKKKKKEGKKRKPSVQIQIFKGN